REQTSQRKSACLRQPALCDGTEVAQSRFRCQQVVMARVAAPLRNVVSDHQLSAHLVEQEVIVDLGKRGCLQRERFDGDYSCPCALCTLRDKRLHCVELPCRTRSLASCVLDHRRHRGELPQHL